MAWLAAWKSGAGDFLIRLGRLVGSCAKIAATPSGGAPVRFRAAEAAGLVSVARGATRARYASGERCFQQGRGEKVTVSEVVYLRGSGSSPLRRQATYSWVRSCQVAGGGSAGPDRGGAGGGR